MILKNTAIYTLGNVIPKAIAFLLVPLYSRILTTGDYGVIGGIGALNGILGILLTLALDRSVFRLYWDHKTEEARKRYLGTIILALAAVSTGFALLFLFPLRPLLGRVYSEIPFFPYYTYGIVTTALHSAGLVPRCYLQIKKKATQFVMLSVTEALCNTLTVAFFVAVLRRGARGYFEALLLVQLLFFPVYGYISSRIAVWRLDWRIFLESARFSTPMIPTLMSAWVIHSLDRVLLGKYATLSDVGLFSMAGQLVGAVLLFFTGFNTAYMPVFYEIAGSLDAKDAKPKLRRYNNGLAMLFALLIATAILGNLMAFDWIIDAKFHLSRSLVPMMLVTAWIGYAGGLTHYSFYQCKRSDVVMGIQLIQAIFHLVLSLFLIRRYAIFGAIATSLVMAIAGAFMRYEISKRFYFVPINGRVLLAGMALIVAGVAPFVVSSWMWQVLLSLVVCILIFGLLYRDIASFVQGRIRLRRTVARPLTS